jgi:hypothetical protein
VNTPWGKSDSKITLARGISFLTTPSHGGFAVTVKTAEKLLTPEAIARGERRGAYLFYEEDCLASIIFFELRTLCVQRLGNVPSNEFVLDSLSHWNSEYLLAVGVTPTAAGLKFFNESRLQDRMRADKSPDLIVSASGDWKQGVPKGTVEVTTADDSRWLIPAEDYDNRANLNLLSNYPRVKPVSEHVHDFILDADDIRRCKCGKAAI